MSKPESACRNASRTSFSLLIFPMLLNTVVLDQCWACDFAFNQTAIVAVEAVFVAAKVGGIAALLAVGTGHLEAIHVMVEDGRVVVINFTLFHQVLSSLLAIHPNAWRTGKLYET